QSPRACDPRLCNLSALTVTLLTHNLPTLLPWSFPGSFRDAYVSHPDITPPLRLGVSTCQLCLVRVLKEEVLEQQCNIGEVPPRLPSILLHRVSQPFHQVLHSSSYLLNIQDCLDLILQMVILNRGRGRWWRVLRRERGGEGWSQQQLIEDPVDFPISGKPEPVPCRPHLLLDREGSCAFVVQLLGGTVHLQVPCVQPDQVPLGILPTWVLAHIVAPLHRNRHFLHCLLGCSS